MLWEQQIEDLEDVIDPWVAPLPPLDDLGEIAETLLVGLPEKFAIIGHSMGGYICFEIMRRVPERVISLGLVATMASQDNESLAAKRQAFIHQAETEGMVSLMHTITSRFLAPQNRENSAIRKRMLKQGYSTGVWAHCQHQRAMAKRPDYTALLPRIQCPTLVLAGRHDPATRLSVKRDMARRIPGAELVVLENSAHMPMLEQPSATSTVIRQWLTGEGLKIAA
jgi:pimeloyl-ACP methyl ester carboxylesterase